MKNGITRQTSAARRTPRSARQRAGGEGELDTVHARILESVPEVRILDREQAREFVRQRQVRGVDGHDEVWEGVYVVPPMARLPHQDLATALSSIAFLVTTLEGRGRVEAGANVSDRRTGWEHNFRVPDLVVVLNGSWAVDCVTHWFGGPDFLAEIQSPDEDTDKKLPFYSKIQVRELLIIHPNTRQMRLYRHNGEQLVLVEPVDFQGGKWLRSEVLSLAFRRKAFKGGPRTEVQRTDGQPGNWTV